MIQPAEVYEGWRVVARGEGAKERVVRDRITPWGE